MVNLKGDSDDAVRFASDAAGLLSAEAVRFPASVVARKPTFDAALRAVKDVLQRLQTEASELQLGAVELEAHHVRCQHEPKGPVLVELVGVLIVKWGPDQAAFWPRAEGVARCLDLIQRFCEMTKSGSDTAFYTARVGPREPEAWTPKR